MKGKNQYLQNGDISRINNLLRASCLLVPSTFSGVCESIDGGYKRAVDWLHFLRFSLPTTIIGFFGPETQKKIALISKICILACQREIRISDIEKMKAYIKEWLKWLKKLIDDKILQPWVLNLNEHFLLHLPSLILFLGPMPAYAAFPVERCIQENKPSIKSRNKPVESMNNLLIELASIHWKERTGQMGKIEDDGIADDGEGDEDDVKALVDDHPDIKQEIWGPFTRVQLQSHVDFLGFDALRDLENYAKQLSPESGKPLDPRSVIEFGSRLWLPDDGSTFGCSANHKEGNKVNFFVKLCLEVNVNRQNGPRITNRKLSYFGEVIRYIRYKFPCGFSKLLAYVKVYNILKSNDDPWPYKTPSAQYKMKLVNIDEIVALCGRNIDRNDREYLYWDYEEMYDLPIGNYNLL
jgi:hypothetical protein